ncbi:hypothetical protein K0504_12910 [Neiella marina]|uniref:HTH crp-type domain-containing protein n=1 Tax=Neiella holothuriorum TaxID=2870530 RepID=A0ABS7EI75_9GAMM|nr:hypothetical protein [Neiella holothuriorum]MBW8191939.1 hypothetical protein [Neiella holothuriorum]
MAKTSPLARTVRKTVLSKDSGEIITLEETEEVTVRRTKIDETFFVVMNEGMERWLLLPKPVMSLLLSLASRICLEDRFLIDISPRMRDELAKLFEVSTKTITNRVLELKRIGILRPTLHRGTYALDPRCFFRGPLGERSKAVKEFDAL